MAGVRHGDTSGGLSSDDYGRVLFKRGGAWNCPIKDFTTAAKTGTITMYRNKGESDP